MKHSLSALGALLESTPEYQRVEAYLGRSRAIVRAQALSEAVPFTAATLWRGLAAPMLMVTARTEEARRLHEQLCIWSGDERSVLHFPETEILPFERLVSDIDTSQQRLRVLARLVLPEGDPPLVVGSVTAIAQRTLDIEAFRDSSHTLERDQAIDLDRLLDLWRRMGYRFEPVVDYPGYVSRRGGILDVYPVGAPAPARIELWGDRIESIRAFDPSTQRSVGMLDSITVAPALETLPDLSDRAELEQALASIDVSMCNPADRERILHELGLLLEGQEVEELSFYSGLFNRGSLLDYLPSDTVLAMHRPSEIAGAALEADERTQALRRVKEGRGELPQGYPSSHMPWKELEGQLSGIGRSLQIMPWGADDLVQTEVEVLPFSSAARFLGDLDRFAEEAQALAAEGHRVMAVSSLPKRLAEILEERGVDGVAQDALDGLPQAGAVTVPADPISGLGDGFVLATASGKLVLLGDAEVFGVAKQRRASRRKTALRGDLLSELSLGDYVVHVEHGIGRFAGTGSAPIDEGGREFLVLDYAAGDKLYVPMDHLDRLSPYVAPTDRTPSLTRLGTQEWRRTKERVERSTREMAGELLSLYAARETVQGHAFSPDLPWLKELEGSFPYEETADQLATMDDVKADMEQIKPMDRLVCGDVGYGKTEIAVRAAFKTVLDNKQVAVLVPTTVLAQQHYGTFSQRLSAYPVRVEVLSRFRTSGEQRAIVEGLANGEIDICIGTHRLVQRDVRFAKLGLVVIDEEQRFGVAHKERLKQMRHEVDVLTLTATPIPRTLHLSMAGIRDMSTIETPPEERLPIKTYVSEFSDELVREAILREVDRQGQVYFLHNRVYNIDYMAEYVRRLVPEATAAVAHGQMTEAQLEQTMTAFANGEIDVLVCTTIIESGLDIANVNTLLVNRSDAFGLAQLYQLRGRIGRGARRAYAYLLVPKARSLSQTAERRLNTMLAATELGAGFRIAMKDLEIRGAGNILGGQQSGHIYAVGFDLYTRMLSEAAEEVRVRREADTMGGVFGRDGLGAPQEPLEGTSDGHLEPPAIELGIPASMPSDYIDDLPTRLGIYQRLVKLTDPAEVSSLEDELLDRFGPLPWQARNLLYATRLKIDARAAGVRSITRESDRIVLRLRDEVGGARNALQRVLGNRAAVGHTQIRLDPSPDAGDWEELLVDKVRALAEFRERLSAAPRSGLPLPDLGRGQASRE